MNKMLVTVVLGTYNHKKYIAQAIESVLMQQTSFDFLLVVCDDCSNDGTQEIVKDYQRRYPHTIEAILDTTNHGLHDQNRAFLRAFFGVKTPYVAIFEGDDYWIDPLKLQKQVNFFEANADFSFCHHHVKQIWDDNRQGEVIRLSNKKEPTTLDILRRNVFSPKNNVILRTQTSSFMFRSSIFKNGRPPDFDKVTDADHYLYLWASLHGKVRVLDEVMSVYRRHAGGLSVRLDRPSAIEEKKNRFINLYQVFRSVLPKKYHFECDYIIQGLTLYYDNKILSEKIKEMNEREYEQKIQHCVYVWKKNIQPYYCKIALYGAGQHTVRLVKALKKYELVLPIVIFDSSPAVDVIDGIQVLVPEQSWDNEIDVIALSTMQFQNDMRDRIAAVFSNKAIPLIDFYN